MYNRRYDKVFLMLRQETAGYGMGQRTPWGSCIMELKNGGGRILLTVQGLRTMRRGQYSVYAIGGVGEEQENFFCGKLTPDASGHGELKWDFRPDGIDKGRMLVEDLHTVAILAEEGSGFSVPLTAYFSKKSDWRPYFHRRTTTEVSRELVVEKEESFLVAAEAAVLDHPQEQAEDCPEEQSKVSMMMEFPPRGMEKAKDSGTKDTGESYHGSFRGLLEKFRQELTELQEDGVFTPEEMDRIAKGEPQGEDSEVDTTEAPKTVVEEGQSRPWTIKTPKTVVEDVAAEVEKKDEKVIPQEIEKPKKILEEKETPSRFQEPTKGNRFQGMFKENTDIYPFGEDGWKCISLGEMILLPEAPLAWQKDFFFLLPMKKYHHFIWRGVGDGFVVGVPGYDDRAEKRDALERGFSQFVQMEDGDLGYWLWQQK